ncbi:MAG: hypothetical protein NTU45_06250 [Planctomycetota bacterium]|nr:hypothetical protein [Planctomycetota bacterium]
MAPKPTEYARRAPEPAATTAVLRWRIGRNGSLVLSVGRIADDIGHYIGHDIGHEAGHDASHDLAHHIEQSAGAGFGSLPVRVELHHGLPAARAASASLSASPSAPPSVSEVVSGRAHGSIDRSDEGCEQRLAITLFRDASPVRAELSLVERADGSPIALTDLPAQLGLRGGTYKLDEGSVQRFATAVRALLLESR